MSKYELIKGKLGHAIIHKVKHKVKFESSIFRCISDLPVDEPLCEIIEEFRIPVVRLKGKNYKVRYVALVSVRKALNILDRQKLDYPQRIITWIHPRETITKQDYNAQVGRQTEFVLPKGGHKTVLVSLADAIQILTVLQKDKERSKLIRKLIMKIEELQEKLNKKDKDDINDRRHLLEQLDINCYNWIKEHQKSVIYKGKEVFGNFAGFIRLWDDELWQMIIDIRYKIRLILGLPVPKKENTGLHHVERPYRIVYPHVATKGQIIDKRWNHEDPRQKRFI